MAQEALNNVTRHAQASHAEVILEFALETATLKVIDDGCGFNVPESPSEMAPVGHFGLLGMQERAELIGAHLSIKSAPERGTSVEVALEVKGTPVNGNHYAG